MTLRAMSTDSIPLRIGLERLLLFGRRKEIGTLVVNHAELDFARHSHAHVGAAHHAIAAECRSVFRRVGGKHFLFGIGREVVNLAVERDRMLLRTRHDLACLDQTHSTIALQGDVCRFGYERRKQQCDSCE